MKKLAVWMMSPTGVGYYQMLQAFTQANPGYRHILIGYSQGGLVARYLAYLDEHLFGNPLIEGVVTLNAPNFGSPLARRENADNVSQALGLVVAGVAQLDAAVFPEVALQICALADTPPDVDMLWLIRLLDKALERFRGNPPLKKEFPGLYGFLVTARKWLSGLESTEDNSAVPVPPVFAHKESAFYDLDMGMLAQAGSVLYAVNRFPLAKIKHAAIVGTDKELDTFTLSGVETFVNRYGWAWGRLFRWLLRPRLSPPLRALLRIASAAYTTAMHEVKLDAASDPHVLQRLQDFQCGVTPTDARYDFQTDEPIGERAHDFVIPSAYQLIESRTDACLGNWVNPHASHLSGADPRLGAKLSQRYLRAILKKMAV